MPPLVAENLDSLKGFVGREIATTDWFTVRQDRIQQFAETTEDRQWIHFGSGAGATRVALWRHRRPWFSDALIA